MTNPTIRVWNDARTEVLFDSWTDDVLFFLEERYLTSGNYDGNSQVVISYSNAVGRKIVARVDINGAVDTEGVLRPNCRITYPNSVPTVTVFLDNTRRDLPVAPAQLTVLYSGGSI